MVDAYEELFEGGTRLGRCRFAARRELSTLSGSPDSEPPRSSYDHPSTPSGADMNERSERLVWLAAGLLLLLVAQQLLAIPGFGRLARGFQNALHGPWFAVVTWCLQSFWTQVFRREADLVAIATGWLLALLVAVLSETLQVFQARDAQLDDVIWNMLGASAALAIWAARAGLLRRGVGLGVALVLLTLSSAPLIRALALIGYQRNLSPILVRFDRPAAAWLYRTNSAAVLTDGVLEVRLAETRWPGITLPEPLADWRGYQALVIELEPAQAVELSVSVRLRGRDHVYRRVSLESGPHTLRLDLRSWFDAEREQVTDVVIYSSRDYAGQTIRFREVRLE